MRPLRLLLLAALTALALAAFAGCGGDKKEQPAALAPARSVVFVDVTLDPKGEQQQAVDEIVGKFPGSGPAGDRVERLLSRAFRESDSKLSYEKDVKPWLGEEAGFFAARLSGGELRDAAALVETKDENAAMDAVKKAAREDGKETKYEGKSYRRFKDDTAAGAFDGYLVVGNEAGVKAAIDSGKGDALDDSKAYGDALDNAPDDRLATVFVNSPRLARSLPGGQSGTFRRLFRDPYTATVTADGDGVEVDSTLPASIASAFGPFLGEGTDFVKKLPGDSWLALGQPDLGKTVSSYIDLIASSVGGRGVIEQQLKASTGLDLKRDLLDWMGDFGVFVRGTSMSSLGGALVIQSKDAKASAHALKVLGRLARRQASGSGTRVGPLSLPGGGTGFTLRDNEVPQPVHVFQRQGKVVVAYGNAAARDALKPRSTLGDDPDFGSASKALGGGFSVSTFVAVKPILALAESLGASSDADYQRAKSYLEPFGALVGGTRKRGDKVDSRLRVTVP
jgi:uncharacterized protein DUF3352